MPVLPNLRTLLIPHKAKGSGADPVQYREYGDDMRAIETWAHTLKPGGGVHGGMVSVSSNSQFGGYTVPGVMSSRKVYLWCATVNDQFQDFTVSNGNMWVTSFPSGGSGSMYVVQFPYVTAPGFTGGTISVQVELQAASADMNSAINATAHLNLTSNEGYQSHSADYSSNGSTGTLTLGANGLLATAAGIYYGSMCIQVSFNGLTFP